MATNVSMYNDILEIIKKNLSYSQTHLEIENDIQICDERSFEGWFQNGLLKPTTIYIIVSFDEGEIWFGNTVIPINFTIYSEQGSFEITRQLLTYFATTYNFIKDIGTNNATIIQSYSVPNMQEEFAEEDNSFRAIFNMSGTFVYGENVSGITSLEIDGEDVTFLNISFDFTTTPNSANIGNLNNRTSTIIQSGTFVMAFSIPSVLSGKNSNLVSKIDSIVLGYNDVNTTFEVKFKKGNNTYPSVNQTRTMHLINVNYEQEITGIPMYAIGLGE